MVRESGAQSDQQQRNFASIVSNNVTCASQLRRKCEIALRQALPGVAVHRQPHPFTAVCRRPPVFTAVAAIGTGCPRKGT